MNYFTKDSEETYPVGIDFSERLPVGTTISSAVVTAVDVADLSNATSAVLSSSTGLISGNVVSAKTKAGTVGHEYSIEFLVTLSDASVLKENIRMKIVNQV